MFWTRKSIAVGGNGSVLASRRSLQARGAVGLAAVAGGVLAGCSTAPQPKPEEVSTAPLVIDEAMQRRADWPRIAAEFQAGGVDAGLTRFPYQPQTEGPDAGQAIFGNERANALFDPFFFVAQTIALPFTYITDPPFTKKNHRGVVYDSTYTAMPLLPPDQDPEERGGHAAPAVPEPEETAPVTPDAAAASDAPEAPEEAPLEIQPEEMPGEEGTPPESTDPAVDPTDTVPDETMPDEPVPADTTTPEAEPEPTVVDPVPDATEPMPETTEPAPEVTEPAPEVTEPVPEVTEPAPDPEPVPESTEPVPEETAEPAPAEDVDENK